MTAYDDSLQALLGADLLAYWAAADASGSLVDGTGNGWTAALGAGTPTYQAAGPTIAGVAQDAVQFDGTAYFSVSSSFPGASATNGRTYIAWVYLPSTTSAAANILSRIQTNEREMSLAHASDGTAIFPVYQSDGNTLVAQAVGTDLDGGTWVCLIGWWDPADQDAHLQQGIGTPASAAGSTDIITDSGAPIGIGASPFGSSPLRSGARLAKLAIVDRVLTADERLAIATGAFGEVKVESFDVDVANGSTHTLTNDVGSTSSAFIRRPGPTDKASGGPIGSTANEAPDDAHIGMALTATDTITFYCTDATSRKVMGEVWRYTGPTGGANEFIKRGSYAVTLSGTSASQAVSGISDEDKCVPFITGISSSSASVNDWDSATVAAHMDGSGNLVVSRNNSTVTVTVYVDVMEFTGANWSVGHGVSSNHDAATETVTLNTDSTGTGGSTFDVGDWETAFIEANMGGDTNETGLADVLALVYPHADTDKVSFSVTDADAGARNDATGYVHVVQHDDIIVKRANDANLAEGNNSYGTATWPTGASTSESLDELALEWFVSTSGTGTAHARGRLNARITDATGTIQHWVHRSGNNIAVRYGVIDLSGLLPAATVSYQDIAAEPSAAATLTVAAGITRSLSANVSAMADAAASPRLVARASAALAGVASAAGGLTAVRAMSVSTSALADATGAVGAVRSLSVAPSTVASVVASMGVARSTSVALVASATTDTDLTVTLATGASVSASASGAAAPTRIAGMAATATAAAVATAAAGRVVSLSAAASAGASLAGSIATTATSDLAATIDATAITSAGLAVSAGLSVAASATANADAVLVSTQPMAASAIATADAGASVALTSDISANVTATAAVIAEPVARLAIAGAAAGEATTWAAAGVSRPASASVTGAASAAAAMGLARPLTGAAAGFVQLTASPTLVLDEAGYAFAAASMLGDPTLILACGAPLTGAAIATASATVTASVFQPPPILGDISAVYPSAHPAGTEPSAAPIPVSPGAGSASLIARAQAPASQAPSAAPRAL